MFYFFSGKFSLFEFFVLTTIFTWVFHGLLFFWVIYPFNLLFPIIASFVCLYEVDLWACGHPVEYNLARVCFKSFKQQNLFQSSSKNVPPIKKMREPDDTKTEEKTESSSDEDDDIICKWKEKSNQWKNESDDDVKLK